MATSKTTNKTNITAEPGKHDFIMIQEFDAPRELVFRAYTDPQLLVRWLGPSRLTMTIAQFEPVSGGRWRYLHQGEDGQAHGFHGVFHEVTAPERIIQTFEYEGLPEKGHVTLETAHFDALPGGRTRVTSQAVYQSPADRDGALQSGMLEGVEDSYSRLDALLAGLQH